MEDSNVINKFKIGDFVEYVPGEYEKPKGSCLLDWAEEYCLEDIRYAVIDANDTDIRIKGKLDPNAQPGSIPDEIWVCAIQFKKWEDDIIPGGPAEGGAMFYPKSTIKHEPGCICQPGVYGSYARCPAHRLHKPLVDEIAKHKTKAPVVNELSDKINFVTPTPDAYDSDKLAAIKQDELHFPAPKGELQQAWVFEILAYCNDLGIDPYQLVEQHQYWNTMAHTQLSEAIKKAGRESENV